MKFSKIIPAIAASAVLFATVAFAAVKNNEDAQLKEARVYSERLSLNESRCNTIDGGVFAPYQGGFCIVTHGNKSLRVNFD